MLVPTASPNARKPFPFGKNCRFVYVVADVRSRDALDRFFDANANDDRPTHVAAVYRDWAKLFKRKAETLQRKAGVFAFVANDDEARRLASIAAKVCVETGLSASFVVFDKDGAGNAFERPGTGEPAPNGYGLAAFLDDVQSAYPNEGGASSRFGANAWPRSACRRRPSLPASRAKKPPRRSRRPS